MRYQSTPEKEFDGDIIIKPIYNFKAGEEE